jgi:hypothetical protein
VWCEFPNKNEKLRWLQGARIWMSCQKSPGGHGLRNQGKLNSQALSGSRLVKITYFRLGFYFAFLSYCVFAAVYNLRLWKG